MKYLIFKLYLTLIMILCFVNPLPAQNTANVQEDITPIDIHFSLNRYRLDLNYLDNNASLLRLQRLLTPQLLSRVDSIVVVSESSPEGNALYNSRLSERRARAMSVFLSDSFPAYTSRLRISPNGESWVQLTDRIHADRKLSAAQKDELRKILSEPQLEVRKSALSKLPYYRQLKQDHYRFIRNSRIYIYYRPLRMLVDSLHIPSSLSAIASIPTVEELSYYPLLERKPEIASARHHYTFAVKSNLLYDLLITPNIELEFPIGRHWSFAAEDAFPWWETGNKYCWQVWHATVEARYWWRRTAQRPVLTGHYFGLYGMTGKYDIQWKRKGCYQGELWSAGLSYGYAMKLSRLFNLEFSLSMGWLTTDYRHYKPTDNYDKLIHDPSKDGRSNYFGPTKLEVSLVLPVTLSGRRKEVAL